MKTLHAFPTFVGALLALACQSQAAVILEDTWTDGSPKEQNLPAESAWFASHATNIVASTGKLSLLSATSSRQFITYFAPPGSPIALANVGETLTATLTF